MLRARTASPLPLRRVHLGLMAALLSVSMLGGSIAMSSATSADVTSTSAAPSLAPTPSTSFAVLRTVSVGSLPQSVAINEADDSVYVTNLGSDSLSIIDGHTGTLVRTIPAGTRPTQVAVHQVDDTVYVTNGDAGNALLVMNGRNTDDSTTYPINGAPFGVAVNQADDTVYVGRRGDDLMSILKGTSLDDSTAIYAGDSPRSIAINQGDDTVYVTNNVTSGTLTAINGASTDDSRTIPLGNEPDGVAVNETDDTVYVAVRLSNMLSVMNGRNLDDSYVVDVGTYPWGVAVDQADGTVFVSRFSYGTDNLAILNGSNTDDSVMLSVGGRPFGIDVDDSGVAYVSNFGSGSVSMVGRTTPTLGSLTGDVGDTIDLSLDIQAPSTFQLDNDTITGVYFDDSLASGLTTAGSNTAGSNRWSVSVPNQTGTVSVTVALKGGLTATAGSFTIGAPARTPTFDTPVATSSGFTVNVTNYDDSWNWTAAVNAGSVTVGTPAGSTLPLAVAGLVAGASATLTVQTTRTGYFNGSGTVVGTASNTPDPPPTYPPSQPLAVTAVAGEASAVVSWSAPTSSGSFPVTTYQVRASPGGGGCMVTTTSCSVNGLANGVAYRFTVRALNGAGWSPWSDPSAAVTPSSYDPAVTITISGSRGTATSKREITVSGVSTGLEEGAVLRPWLRFPGQTHFTKGTARILVDDSGAFEWSRRTGKRVTVYVATPDGLTTSNRVTIGR